VAAAINAAWSFRETAAEAGRLAAEAIALESDYELTWAKREDGVEVSGEAAQLHGRLVKLRASATKYRPSIRLQRIGDGSSKLTSHD